MFPMPFKSDFFWTPLSSALRRQRDVADEDTDKEMSSGKRERLGVHDMRCSSQARRIPRRVPGSAAPVQRCQATLPSTIGPGARRARRGTAGGFFSPFGRGILHHHCQAHDSGGRGRFSSLSARKRELVHISLFPSTKLLSSALLILGVLSCAERACQRQQHSEASD